MLYFFIFICVLFVYGCLFVFFKKLTVLLVFFLSYMDRSVGVSLFWYFMWLLKCSYFVLNKFVFCESLFMLYEFYVSVVICVYINNGFFIVLYVDISSLCFVCWYSVCFLV